MGLFSPDILQQQRAAAGPNLTYPAMPILKKEWTFIDEFNRQTLNPTNAVALYTFNENGAGGSGALTASNTLTLTTDTTIGNDASVVLDEFSFIRTPNFVDIDRVKTTLDVLFRVSTSADSEGYIGLDDDTSLSAVPTTSRHIGIKWDKSADTDYFLTDANDSTENTTDTGEVANGTFQRLNIVWDGLDSATVKLFNGTNFETQVSSQTLTDSGFTSSTTPYLLHFFIQTEASAAKVLDIFEWRVKFEET